MAYDFSMKQWKLKDSQEILRENVFQCYDHDKQLNFSID